MLHCRDDNGAFFVASLTTAPSLSFGHPFPARGKELVTIERERAVSNNFHPDFNRRFSPDLASPSAADLFDILSEARAKQKKFYPPNIFRIDFFKIFR